MANSRENTINGIVQVLFPKRKKLDNSQYSFNGFICTLMFPTLTGSRSLNVGSNGIEEDVSAFNKKNSP